MSVRGGAAACVALLLTAAVAWLTRVPVELGGDEGAVLRLSWRVAGVRVEACRERSARELERVPVHMRAARECARETAPWALTIVAGGEVVARDTLRPAGARADRPLSVLTEVALEPGAHQLSVDFEAVPPSGAGRPPDGDGSVTRLSWTGSVRLRAGEVALLTLDDAGRDLRLVRRP